MMAGLTFDKAFRLASMVLLTAGFLSLYSAEAVALPLTLAYLGAVALSWRIRLSYSDRTQIALFALLVVLFLFDAVLVSDFVTATVHLLIVVSLIKLFSTRTDRDYMILYLISFGFLLFASAYTISLAFLSALILYIFCAILTFILFESKAAYEKNKSAPFELVSYLGVALAATVLIAVVSVPIFLVIPRVSLGLLRMDRTVQLNMSGFSDQVTLGDIGKIILNSNVVMRVRVEQMDRLPPEAKWRGIALDRYDGKRWSNTRPRFRRIRRDRQYEGYLVSGWETNDYLVQQSVILEPFSNMLFGTPDIVMLSGDGLRRRALFADGNGSVGLYGRGRGPIRYVAHSDMKPRSLKLEIPVEGETPRSVTERYLELPEIHPQIRTLALTITQGQEGPVAKSLAIEKYLKESYGYSLANESSRADDPLFDFLLRARAGHCEFFATAQAVMMRLIGIPTRLVNGFHKGDYNPLSDYFVVRQSHAHSWVEGYFPGPGWMEFDPTPPAPDSEAEFSLARIFTQVLDAVDVMWTEIVTFDRLKQVGFFRTLRDDLEMTWNNVSRASLRLGDLANLKWLDARGWKSSNLVYLLFLPVAGLLAGVAYRYRRYLRVLWKRRILRHSGSEIAPEYYLEMLDVLDRRGFSKQPGETPAEFARRLESELDTPVPAAVTELYYRNRYGQFSLGDEDLSQVYRWLKELRQFRIRAAAQS